MPIGIPPPAIDLGVGQPNVSVPGTGDSMPPGLESILEYNGLYLNLRAWADTYLVTNISGLEDADVRDDREVNPQAHGETAFDSYYGGRTITISGKIRAFTLNKLRDMQQALKRAFADLSEEKPLVFHRQHAGAGADCLVFCKKSAPIAMAETNQKENIFEREFMITLRASNFRFLALNNKMVTVPLGWGDAFATNSLEHYTTEGDTGSLNFTGGELKFTNTSIKRLIRNDLTFFSSNQEVIMEYTPSNTFTGSITRLILRWLNPTNFLFGQVDEEGNLRIYAYIDGESTLVSPTVTIPARTAETYYMRMRAIGNDITLDHGIVDYRLDPDPINWNRVSATLSGTEALVLGSGVAGNMGFDITPGDTNWAIDNVSGSPINLNNSEIAVVNNLGNFNSQPLIKMRGHMEDVILTNSSTSDSLQIDGIIEAGDEYTIDIAEGTMENANGDNRFNQLAITSDWPEIVAGSNPMLLTVDNMRVKFVEGDLNAFEIPSISISHRDSWI